MADPTRPGDLVGQDASGRVRIDRVLPLPWVLGILGLCIGSFLNVVIHRLPIMMERDWASQCAALR